MIETYKCLGQAQPASITLTALYVLPESRRAVCSSLSACNTGDNVARIRVSHAIAGEADAVKQYVIYDTVLAPKQSLVFTLGMTLAATDELRVRSDNGLVAFNAWGTEIA